jgi:murein DD-endopeptidase MepM/ murein hydrolase activator NlpD
LNFTAVIFFLVTSALFAQHPEAFSTLAKSFEEDTKAIEAMKQQEYFQEHETLFKEYEERVNHTFEMGFELDDAIDQHHETSELKDNYLKALRELENDQKALELVYVHALNDAIAHNDIKLFIYLMKHPMRPLKNERVRNRALGYYETIRSKHKIMECELLRQEKKFDAYSRKIAFEEQHSYEEHLKVLTASQAKKIRQSGTKSRRNRVLVSRKEIPNGISFYAENFNAYSVTLLLKFKTLQNYIPNKSLPTLIELQAGEKKNILQMVRDNPKLPSRYQSTYSWVMGVTSAQHDKSYLYRVPFKRGTTVRVSQGFNGSASHKGYSRYAVDFAVNTGTPIYAAREGRVVATKSNGNRGGFERSFGQYANFIVIEHSDGTFGKYYHLKQGGVAVRINQRVKQGELIGYSGNTGYSSGPHLHFSVSKVASKDRLRPVTVPFKFQTASGVITAPKRGDRYTVP